MRHNSLPSFGFIVAVLLVLYATFPWDIGPTPHLARVQWIPFWNPARHRPPSLWDLAENVLLFVPFGFFGRMRQVRQRAIVPGVLAIGFSGLALSCCVEGLQILSPTRTPSASDVASNVIGTIVGATVALAYRSRLGIRPPLDVR
jgi:VanZ family protein